MKQQQKSSAFSGRLWFWWMMCQRLFVLFGKITSRSWKNVRGNSFKRNETWLFICWGHFSTHYRKCSFDKCIPLCDTPCYTYLVRVLLLCPNWTISFFYVLNELAKVFQNHLCYRHIPFKSLRSVIFRIVSFVYQGYIYLLKNSIQNSNSLVYFKILFIPAMQSWI